MEKKIVVSKRFRKNTLKIYEYLIIEYSHKTAFNFLDKLQQRVDLITKYPEIGKPSQKKENVRSVTLNHTTEFIIVSTRVKSNFYVCLI